MCTNFEHSVVGLLKIVKKQQVFADSCCGHIFMLHLWYILALCRAVDLKHCCVEAINRRLSMEFSFLGLGCVYICFV